MSAVLMFWQLKTMNWKVPSFLLFQCSCLYNQDVWCVWSWQAEAPGPSSKAKMFNGSVWGKLLWKDMHNGECISNVFLWAPVCMSSLFAMLLNTTERKPFLCLLSMSNTGKMVAKWKEHIALPAEFSPKQNNFVISNNMGPKPQPPFNTQWQREALLTHHFLHIDSI